jgi:enterochelin esterase-like enzyme
MKANNYLILSLVIFVLSGCTIGFTKTSTHNSSTCTAPGTIGRDKVPHPTRGFNVSFQYYLPPCYESLKSSRFPVIYLITVPFEYRLDDTADTPMSLADRLIRAGKMLPAILIVPDDTVGFGYHAALAIDLIPYVDKKFNTVPQRQYRGVGGISHGGAIAARMAIQFPDEFGSLGILSGGIATGETGTFEAWIASASSESRPRIRIDLGDQDIGILPLTQNLTKVLDHNNVPYTLTMGRGGHTDFFWSPLMEPYLLWFAEAWK